MHPCVRCAKKGNCPERCKPKADYIRHMKRLNRQIRREQTHELYRQEAAAFTGSAAAV